MPRKDAFQVRLTEVRLNRLRVSRRQARKFLRPEFFREETMEDGSKVIRPYQIEVRDEAMNTFKLKLAMTPRGMVRIGGDWRRYMAYRGAEVRDFVEIKPPNRTRPRVWVITIEREGDFIPIPPVPFVGNA